MIHWFGRNFEDPANETPYETREGGYQYIWGGPYDAAEELFAEFGDIVLEDRIRQAVDKVESDGITNWAPSRNHPNHPNQQYAREELVDEYPDDKPEERPLQQVLKMLESGATPIFGGEEERAQRREILSRLDVLEAELKALKPAHGGIGHNRPPEDEETSPIVGEVQEAVAEIGAEMVKATPDALAVAQATSRLQTAIGWLQKKADTAVDAFAKSLGNAAGISVAGLATYVTSQFLPGVAKAASDVVSATIAWLQTVTGPF
ncbi:UNVERIFIED_ORG: hypothetical protein ABID33_000285 [Xanthobacter viscosus]|uniref:Uncharacterized protein n=1 Tax=Xanthobacter autotrophicus TaxID=280 RepID=A0A6C1KHR5_XANAU|nr:hypothetical protein [Xanthobacter autotrophicus]TLX43828.1 hypothetical protein FBQ73_06930 [Xanthobacter autotrophicus]